MSSKDNDGDPWSSDPRDQDFLASILEQALEDLDPDLDLNDDQVQTLILDGLPDATERYTTSLVATLNAQAPQQLRRMRRQQRGFERRLHRRWGKALDQYRILWVCMQEQGSTFNHARGSGEDPLGSALVGLHARACRVAWEVHTLLEAGLGMGALARCRTLHEMAVLTSILADWHGPGPVLIPDLAERFAARGHVIAYKDALEYQRNAAALNAEPFTQTEMDDLKRRRDLAVATYGSLLGGRDYGWATGVGKFPNPTFRELEDVSGLSHLRSYYRWATHEVHADAHGIANNLIDVGDGNQVLLAGPSNTGLADPAQAALISLNQITTIMLVHGGRSPGLTVVVGLQAVKRMLDRACEDFAAVEHDIRRASDHANRRPRHLQRNRSTLATLVKRARQLVR